MRQRRRRHVAPMIFRDEGFLEDAFGCEGGDEGGEGSGVFFFLAFADEIAAGEQAEFGAVARGLGFACFGAWTGGPAGAGLGGVLDCVCDFRGHRCSFSCRATGWPGISG